MLERRGRVVAFVEDPRCGLVGGAKMNQTRTQLEFDD